jgi:hypothetical protein
LAKGSVDNSLVALLLDEGAVGPAAAWLRRGEGSIHTLSTETALAVVEAARQLGLTERLLAAQAADDKAVRKAAGAALHKLKSAGVAVGAARAPKVAGLAAEAIEVQPPRALLGLPGGNGYFPFVLMSFSGTEAIVCMGIAGAAQGYLEENHAHLPRAEARNFLYTLRSQKGLVEVPFALGLSVVERALQASGRKLPGWGHLVENIDPFALQMARLKAMSARAAGVGADEAVIRSAELSRGIGPITPMLDEADVQGALSAVLDLQGEGEERLDRVEGLVAEAIDRVFGVPLARETWVLALDVAAELYDLEELPDQARLARGLAGALAAGQPASTIPFFTEPLQKTLMAFLP